MGKSLGDKKRKVVYARSRGRVTRTVNTTKKESESFVLDDNEVLRLAEWACAIEKHYEKPMDIEWAPDGETGQIFIVQARPETVQALKEAGLLTTYRLKKKGNRSLHELAVAEPRAAAKVYRSEMTGQ